MQRSAPRDFTVDLLKTFAIFGVVLIHVSSSGFYAPINSFNWTATLFLRCLVSASVPLFFMTSGVLWLNPEKPFSLRRLLTKNLLRLIAAMLFWAFLYKLYHLAIAGTFSLRSCIQALKEVLLFKQEFHLYFLHIMLIVYLWLPVTRKVVQHCNRQELLYALGLWFLFGILYPTVRSMWPFSLLGGIPGQMLINMTYAAIGYLLLGYYLHKYPLPLWGGLLCIAAGFAFVFVGTLHLSFQTGTLSSTLLEGMSLGVAVLAAGFFSAATHCKPCPLLTRITAAVSKASFCIYLVHVLFIYIVQELGWQLFPPYALSIPLYTAFHFLLSFAVYQVLKRIPVVNRWII